MRLGIQEAPRGHPRRSRRHPGGTLEAPCGGLWRSLGITGATWATLVHLAQKAVHRVFVRQEKTTILHERERRDMHQAQ